MESFQIITGSMLLSGALTFLHPPHWKWWQGVLFNLTVYVGVVLIWVGVS